MKGSPRMGIVGYRNVVGEESWRTSTVPLSVTVRRPD